MKKEHFDFVYDHFRAKGYLQHLSIKNPWSRILNTINISELMIVQIMPQRYEIATNHFYVVAGIQSEDVAHEILNFIVATEALFV